MPYERSATRLPDEVHCYFPEWADRPDSADSLLEADRNSYLAGGYSEEFGYHVRPDRPSIFPLLFEDPERSCQWDVQIGCLHPGYPECPRPADRGTEHARGSDANPRELNEPKRSPDHLGQSAGASRSESPLRVVRVSRSGIERHVLRSIAALGARFRIRLRVRDRGI